MTEEVPAQDVVVYTTPFCAPCDALKRYLSSHDVAFRVRDLLMDEDAQDRLEEARIRSTPVLEIDGVLHAGEALEPDNVKRLLRL
ncbi:MAG: glutaredoxin family protein [Alphaproteobacteria bacterium]